MILPLDCRRKEGSTILVQLLHLHEFKGNALKHIMFDYVDCVDYF